MSVFQDHVLPNAKEDLAQSELFTNEDSIDPKEKEFVKTVANKSSKDLTSKELDKLKIIARKSISASIRVKIWLLLSGGADITYQSLYEETCEELFTEDGFIPDGEEGNYHAYLTYYLTPEGGKKLRRLLCVLKHLNPDITYCPLLEPIVSILLHFMNEEDAFACASGLLSGQFVSPFLDQTKVENITTDATLQDLFKSYHKKAFNRVNTFLVFESSPGIEKEVLFPSWRMNVFEHLDFVSLTRIFDCLLVEGVKILYRIGLYLLEVFYQYSLTFEKLHCHTPQDLVATIGQYTVSLKMPAEDLLKHAMKINITTKQIQKAKQENTKLYKANKLEWIENVEMKQVVAVDLRQVSDIIKPNQWQTVSEWLPSRIQIKQPQLLFSTNRDGYNLKTLYLMCEEEEQTLMIVETSTKEIFGAYLSTALTHRHEGKTNMSYFGTGETFLFKLSPNTIAYHWNKKEDEKATRNLRKKMSTYVFVDTKPLMQDEVDSTKAKPVKKSRKTSMKRTFSRKLSFAAGSKPSFNRSVSRSAYTKRDKISTSLHPLSYINIKKTSFSVPKRLYLMDHEEAVATNDDITTPAEPTTNPPAAQKSKKLISAQTIDLGDMKKLQKSSNVEIVDDEDGLIMRPAKSRSQSEYSGGAKPKLQKSKIVEDTITEEEFDVPSIEVNGEVCGDSMRHKKVELFISCDNSRMIVGGGESGNGLWIDGELSKGRSMKCDTFGNSPLSDGDNGDFTILRIDVFGFQ